MTARSSLDRVRRSAQHAVAALKARVRGETRNDSTARYLNLLEAALLNEFYLDHELRLRYMDESLRHGVKPDPALLGDPVREMPVRWAELVERRRRGPGTGDNAAGSKLPYTDVGRPRLAHLRKSLDAIREQGVAGDFVEVGPGRGGAGMFMRGYLDAYGLPGQLWVADDFRVERKNDDELDVWTDLHALRDGYARFGLLDERVHFVRCAALSEPGIDRVALLQIGRSAAKQCADLVDRFRGRLVPGAFVIVEDLGLDEATIAGIKARLGAGTVERVDASAICFRMPQPVASPNGVAATSAVVAPKTVRDLTVLVVVHNMRREAARTLYSLSRAYQQDVDDIDYEVIVVDNGSKPEQLLGADFVREFGPEFRYLEMGSDASASPVAALNRAFEMSSGRVVAFMIDGAHLLTPGVLHHALIGIRTYEPAIVATQMFYIGPGQQHEVVRDGYNQAYEDELFREISWPDDGYRLFEIAQFFGYRDWLDGMWESNCLFVSRALLEQAGAFDERFALPAGGFANMEFYERLARTPGVNIVTMLGEGSFHQVHGGATTNAALHERRDLSFRYRDDFAEHTGRPFRGANKTMHFVGTMPPVAARTRARRMTPTAFLDARSATDGVPTAPTPIPDDLRMSFIDAFWTSLAWQRTRWLGQPTMKAPTDLFAYQEIVSELRPDWIVETGTQEGGRALMFASLCELLGHGRVISIDRELRNDLPSHPRIEFVPGDPAAAATVEHVRELVQSSRAVLFVLGSAKKARDVEREFAAYRDLVPPNSFVVIENTIVNGHPVWPEHGPGPREAVRNILARDRDFVSDTSWERYGLSFNLTGFLKRRR